MLKDLFPKAYGRYLSLPKVGPVVEDFVSWLQEQGYRHRTRVLQVREIVQIESFLRRRGFGNLCTIKSSDLEGCWTWYRRRNPNVASTVHVLQRFLEKRGLLAPSIPQSQSGITRKVSAYADHLMEVRGFGRSAVRNHIFTATRFLEHLKYQTVPSRLAALSTSDIEAFIRAAGKRLGRGSLGHTVAQLRGFLRFLASEGLVRPGLDQQIDTPRLYRFEQLPRSLPWDTVRTFLQSIDRTTPVGLRNYAMFFLTATYGLRRSEIVALTLDDIDWRGRSLRIAPQKNGYQLVLPLTDDVGDVLLEYLRHGRPTSSLRQLFLHMRAPAGALTPSAVTQTFRVLIKRSGLGIPVQGPHCLRHSYAAHLLRQGTSLKAIGDLLGHRMAESTAIYLRLAVEDLRGVALPIPRESSKKDGKEVQL